MNNKAKMKLAELLMDIVSKSTVYSKITGDLLHEFIKALEIPIEVEK